MRARKERAGAHAALGSLVKMMIRDRTVFTAQQMDMIVAAREFTKPRPWWRFW